MTKAGAKPENISLHFGVYEFKHQLNEGQYPLAICTSNIGVQVSCDSRLNTLNTVQF